MNDSTSIEDHHDDDGHRPDHGRQLAAPAEEHLGALHPRRGPVRPLRPALHPRRRGVGRGHGRRGPPSGDPPGHDLGAVRRRARTTAVGNRPGPPVGRRAGAAVPAGAVLAGAVPGGGAVLAGAVPAGAVPPEAALADGSRPTAGRERPACSPRHARRPASRPRPDRAAATAGRPSGTAGGRGPGRAGPRVRLAGSPAERPGSMRCPARSHRSPAWWAEVSGGVVGGWAGTDEPVRGSDPCTAAAGPAAEGPAEPSRDDSVAAVLGAAELSPDGEGPAIRVRGTRMPSCSRPPALRTVRLPRSSRPRVGLPRHLPAPQLEKVAPIRVRWTRMRRHRFPVPSSDHPSPGCRPWTTRGWTTASRGPTHALPLRARAAGRSARRGVAGRRSRRRARPRGRRPGAAARRWRPPQAPLPADRTRTGRVTLGTATGCAP